MRLTNLHQLRVVSVLTLLVAVALALAAPPAEAAQLGIGVSPTWVDLSAAGGIPAALTLINQGQKERTTQVSIYRWLQTDGGAEELTPTEDIRFFPKMVTLPPGERAVIRLVYTGKPQQPGGADLTYRLKAEEVAVTAVPGTIGLRFAMTLPVFVATGPTGMRAEPELAWSDVELRDGALVASLTNRGMGPARIPKAPRVELLAADGTEILSGDVRAGSAYVLPGATREYALSLAPEACLATRSIRVKADWGRIEGSDPVAIPPFTAEISPSAATCTAPRQPAT